MADTKDLDWWIWSQSNDKTFLLTDHFGSFDPHYKNKILDEIPAGATCYSEYQFPDAVKAAYPDLELKFSALLFLHGNSIFRVSDSAAKINHGAREFKNFVCSFNRSNQKARHWLLASLNARGWFSSKYTSKHFELSPTYLLEGNIDPESVAREFAEGIYSFDFDDPTDHIHNMSVLSPMIQDSFVTLVSESVIDSNVAFPTEKFLYPIANKRMWLAYAPPNYHKMLHQQFKIELLPCFDYYFDSIFDPVQRLTTMLGMLEPFSRMSRKEWENLYKKYNPIIEYNYNQLANFDFFKTIVDQDECPLDVILDTVHQSDELRHFVDCKTKR